MLITLRAYFSFRKYRLSLPRKGFARLQLCNLTRPFGSPEIFGFATTNPRPSEFPLTSPGKKRIVSETALCLFLYNIQLLKSLFYGRNIQSQLISYHNDPLPLENDSRILSDIALVLDKHNFVFWAFQEQQKVAHDNLLLPGQISLIVQSLIRAQRCYQCIL